jgi:pyrimidine-specific ribonucleoside hydrolase
LRFQFEEVTFDMTTTMYQDNFLMNEIGARGSLLRKTGKSSVIFLLTIIAVVCNAQPKTSSESRQEKKIPVINITDLYHPYQDPGDNFDLIMGYALPELDLQAVILEITDAFRKPVADHPTLWKDPRGPREAGVIPVMQLNYIFDRHIPFALSPFTAMKSLEDKMLDAPKVQQQGIELFLETLRESKEPLQVVSFGSARVLAIAYNRDPELLRKKIGMVHLSAGTASPDYKLGKDEGANAIPGGEWNVALDVYAFIRVMTSDLPIAIYPCATTDGAFALGRNNSYWKLPDLQFVQEMDPGLRRYLDFAFGKTLRHDFLRAMDVNDSLTTSSEIYPKPHHVWETAVWTNVSGRLLVQRKDGSFRMVTKQQVKKGDQILPNDLKPCVVKIRDDGRFVFEFTKSSNFYIYDRGDPHENQKAFSEALPALYLSFRATPIR